MSSKRLNQIMREQIINAGAEFIVRDQRVELWKFGSQILAHFRKWHYEPRVLAAMDFLPAAFLTKVQSVTFTINHDDGGQKSTIKVEADETFVFANGDVFDRYGKTKLLIVGQDPQKLIDLILTYEETSKAIEANVAKFKAMAKPILAKCSTVQKLLETWPQSKNFIPAHILAEKPKEYLPVDVTKTLDSMVLDAVKRQSKAEAQTSAEA